MSEEIFQFLSTNPQFVSDVSPDLKCNLCKSVMINASFTPCGCEFCYSCIRNYLGNNEICPAVSECCSNQIIKIEDITQNQAAIVKINRLLVKCTNICCNYRDNVSNIVYHLETCDKVGIKCPLFDFGCLTSRFDEESLNSHMIENHGRHLGILTNLNVELKASLNQIEVNKIHLVNDNREFKEKIGTFDMINEELEKKMEKIKQENGELKAQNYAIETRFEHLAERDEEIKNENREMKKTHEEFKISVFLLVGQLKENVGELERGVNVKNVALKQKYEEIQIQLDILRSINEEMGNGNNGKVGVENMKFEKENEEIKKSMKDIKAELNFIKKEFAKIKNENEKVVKKSEEVQGENQEIKRNFINIDNKINLITKRNFGKKEKIPIEQEKIQESIKNIGVRIDLMTRNNLQIQKNVQNNLDKINLLGKENVGKNQKNKEIQKNIKIIEDKMDLMEKGNLKREAENKNIQEKVSSMDLMTSRNVDGNEIEIGSHNFSPFNWILNEIGLKKKMKFVYFSPPFYSHVGGYKMRVGVLFAETSLDKYHLKLLGQLMRSENDNHLTWPFTKSIKVKLINRQDEAYGSYVVKFNGSAACRPNDIVSSPCMSQWYPMPSVMHDEYHFICEVEYSIALSLIFYGTLIILYIFLIK